MSSLSYIVIFNSDCKLDPPSTPSNEERDEDAQEAAQVVFYSSNKQVTTRDKMLRHLGLAKGLENFAK